MRRYFFINFTAGGITLLTLLMGGCASHQKKPVVPESLEKEIRSIEGETPSSTYIIQKGDTLWRVSKKYGIPVEQLRSANHIDNVKDLKVGQKLVIPSRGKSVSTHTKDNNNAPLTNIGKTVSASGFIWPVNGRISAHYGKETNGSNNAGIKIIPQAGQKIVATKKGTVEAVSDLGDGKHALVLKHAWGIRTLYGCRCTPLVREGDYVEQRQPIANLLQGGSDTSQEISFKIYIKDKPVNPLSHLP